MGEKEVFNAPNSNKGYQKSIKKPFAFKNL
jgi:hypothetical protein